MVERLTLVFGVTILFATAACEPSGATITVRLQSGLRAGVEARYAEVRLQSGVASCRGGGTTLQTTGRVLEEDDQSALGGGALGVAELRGLEPGLYTVRARLQSPPRLASGAPDSGETIVERCVAVSLTNSRVVRIALTVDCVGVTCPWPGGNPAFDQCLNGRCVDPRCDPEDSETAEHCCDVEGLGAECESAPTVCDEDADCDPTLMCSGMPRCERGACIEPDTDLCGAGEHCSVVDDRCVADPLFADAGMTDAATLGPDAGPPGMGLLCDPCGSTSECSDARRCVAIAPSVRVCLRACTVDAPDCPRGFTCADDGAGALACVPLGGICCIDEDGDGYGTGRGCMGTDCDDADDDRNPGRVELCNGIDDDCDLTPDDPPTDCAGGTCDPVGAAFAESGAQTCRAGACGAGGGTLECGLFTCDGGGDSGDRCARTCTAVSDDDDRYCLPSAHCDVGTCVADAAPGGSCDEDSDCATARCASGVCCTPGVGGCTCAGGPTEMACDDASDSDCDGRTDCADADCAGRSCGPRGRTCVGTECACPGGATEEACRDGMDNDCDGLVDCGDADCGGEGCGSSGQVCVGTTCACAGGAIETLCEDGRDNDCDGLSDCADGNCDGRVCGAGRVCGGTTCLCAGGSSESVCSDDADSDCDGMIDCADSDCDGRACADGGRTCAGGSCQCATGGSETRCDDSSDGDCDSLIDCDDPDCAGQSCGSSGRTCAGTTCTCPGGTSESNCGNGMDDDCDGQIDCLDSHCAGAACASGRVCMGNVCRCAGGATELNCGDGADEDCDGMTDCGDPDCVLVECGGGNRCCGSCTTVPPMYTRLETSAAMCATMLGGMSFPGLCSLALFYRSACGPLDMSPYAPGWTHAPSAPAGCDYNGCDPSGNCQENFCIPCPGGDCNACPDNPPVTPC